MNAEEWLKGFAAQINTDVPSNEEIEKLLAIAGVAAHSSERIAAPIACYLIGRAGLNLDEARRLADTVG